MKFTAFLFGFILICLFSLRAQQYPIGKKYHNKTELAVGYSYIPSATKFDQTTVLIPNISVEYYHWFYHRLGMAFWADVELGSYLFKFEDREVSRTELVILVFGLQYEILPRLVIGAGLGNEIGQKENFPVFRSGIYYDIKFNERWSLAPAFFYDYKYAYDSFFVELGIGYWFGGTWGDSFLNRNFKNKQPEKK